MDTSQDKVPAPRLPLQMAVEFRRSYARQADRGTLKNISLTGAFIETPDNEALTPSDKIVLDLVVSGRKRKMQATVVWKNAKGCGIKFLPFNNRDVQLVDDLIYFVESKRESRRSVLENIFKHVS